MRLELLKIWHKGSPLLTMTGDDYLPNENFYGLQKKLITLRGITVSKFANAIVINSEEKETPAVDICLRAFPKMKVEAA